MLMDEAGGVKASARDVAQWVQLNLQADPTASPVLQAGIQRAQQRYAQSAQMYQGLGWEMLDYPVTLTALTAVTAPDFVKGHAATLLDPASGAEPVGCIKPVLLAVWRLRRFYSVAAGGDSAAIE